MSLRYILKITAIACFALLVIALVIAHESPVTGYEINYYASTSRSIWFYLFLSFVGGTVIIIHQIITRDYQNNNIWLLGIIVIVFSKIIYSCISYVMGYKNRMGDIISQGGVISSMLDTGHISDSNFYPVTHILASKIVLVTAIPGGIITNFSTLILVIPFLLSTYLLATDTLSQQGQQVLAIVAATTVSVSISLLPNGWSMFLLPLFFYLYFQRDIHPYRVILVILLILYPFFHPLSSFFIILSLLVMESSHRIFPSTGKARKISKAVHIHSFNPNLVLLESIIFFTWILNFKQFYANIRSMWHDLLTLGNYPMATEMIKTASKISRTAVDYITLYWDMYGLTTILLLLSLSGIYYFIKQIHAKNSGKENIPFFTTVIIFLGTWCLFLLYLLGFPGLSAIATDRIIRYANIICAIPVAFGLYELLKGHILLRIVAIILLCLMLIPSILVNRGLLGYNSKSPSLQVTTMDMAGMVWFIQKKDTNIGCIHVMSPPYRYADAILGNVEAIKRLDIKYAEQFTDHFAYNEYDELGEHHEHDNYTAITKLDRILYETMWKQVGRYSFSDFNKLEHDPTVDSIYSNCELDVYFIHGTGIQ